MTSGRELAAHRRLAREARSRAAVQSDQSEVRRIKPVEKKGPIDDEFEITPPDDSDEDDATRNRRLKRLMQGMARQISLDPSDGMELRGTDDEIFLGNSACRSISIPP